MQRPHTFIVKNQLGRYFSNENTPPPPIINLKNLLHIRSPITYPLVYIPGIIKNQILSDYFYKVSDADVEKKYDLKYNLPSKPVRPTSPREPDNYEFIKYDKLKVKEGFGLIPFLISLIVLYSRPLKTPYFIEY